MKNAIINFVASFTFGLGGSLFIQGILADFFYSNCVNVGNANLSCTNGGQILQPLVVSGSYWYLTPFQYLFGYLGIITESSSHPYIPLSDTMGIVAGLGFIILVISFGIIRRHQSIPRLIQEIGIFSGGVYILMMIGFIKFLPFCLTFQCRITNYLPWISYDEGFLGASAIFTACFCWRLMEMKYSKREILETPRTN